MVASSHTLTVTTPSDREIVMTRTFDAPRGLVWEALSKPEHMREWWGPRGFTMPVCEIDLRVGGAYRFVQKGPDGAEYGFRGEYREIVPPERIGWTFEFEGMPGSISVDTMTLTEEDGKTTITSTSVFDSVEQRDGMLQSGMETGAAETYDRLAELLEKMQESIA
ncbi:MAG: SRPBCC family protein [Actinobacteria bacterium]|nr:SRPBCC family protein [Actinomycetota bacterium]MDQ3425616.1 SRPBCC family protein [Actinomycetota bacterium]